MFFAYGSQYIQNAIALVLTHLLTPPATTPVYISGSAEWIAPVYHWHNG